MDTVTAHAMEKEGEAIASLIKTYPGVRASVGPWVAGFGPHGTRRGHNVIWVWSDRDEFPPRLFDQRKPRERVAAVEAFVAGSAQPR